MWDVVGMPKCHCYSNVASYISLKNKYFANSNVNVHNFSKYTVTICIAA